VRPLRIGFGFVDRRNSPQHVVKDIVLRHDQGTPKDSPEFVGFRSFSAGNATGSGRNYAWPVQRLTANLFGREERNLR
jgi:hypothetical protein